MALDLGKVTNQIEEMGRVLAEQAGRQRKTLPAARELLHRFANQQEELRRIAESDPGRNQLGCASPGDEPLDARFPTPPLPEHVTIVASDGSQIYPDQHGMAFYYAINVGSVVFRHGSGQAPEVSSEPALCYGEEQVYPNGSPVNADRISAQRDLAEMQELARLALREPSEGPPRVALGDGSLLIWLQRKDIPDDQQTQILEGYLGCLDRLRGENLPVAAFVSRPRSAEVVALLYLAHLEPEERGKVERLSDTGFRGLADRALFGYLRPGERSALFVRGIASNRQFQDRGHAATFFYLNTGTDLARVEVPEWTARQPDRLDLVHAAVYEQCRFNNGYPYVLTRADELAVILGDEREALENLIVQSLVRHGLPWPELSRKAQQKQVARWRRR
jgi:hypothetical protein